MALRYSSLFGGQGESCIESVYGKFADLAESYGVKLILAYQVVPCPVGEFAGMQAVRAELQAFMAEHPNVIVPFDIADTCPEDRFAIPAHTKHEFSEELSRRLGEALQPHFADLSVAPRQ